MSRIEVVKQIGKGKREEFRVLVNNVQEGCIVHSSAIANKHANQIAERYQDASVFLFVEIHCQEVK